jgi:hypothetical protein
MVTGTRNQAVAWSVLEAGGGAVDAAGRYTAPSRAGIYHVLATSAMDPRKTAIVPVVVPSAWGTATPIEPETSIPANDAYHPRIAFDRGGKAVAVWQQSDGAHFRIWANTYVPGTGWGSAAPVEPADAGDSEFPQIACDGNGNAMAVWQQTNGDHYSIWANRLGQGTGWGTPTLIETANGGNTGFPQIAFDGRGNALAIWEQDDGSHYAIWANHFMAQSGWGTAALVDGPHSGNALTPQIAIDGNGNALAVWSQSNGVQFTIWANECR